MIPPEHLRNLRNSFFLLSVSFAPLFCVKSRGYFGEAAETCRRAPARAATPDLWNPCHPWSSAPSCIRVYSCPFVAGSENRKKFSLNPVEGIGTSASMFSLPPSRRDYGGQARVGAENNAEKEQVRFMKITQNVENLEQKETKLTKGFWFSRTLASFAIFCNCLFLLSATAFAQNADSIANREVQRRQAAIPAGEAALARGKTAMSSKNYTVAYQEFKTAIGYLPDAVVSGRAHDDAAEGVCKSGTVLAEARIAQGDYAGAEAILNEIITRYDPNCRKAQDLLAHMRQPGYFNKTVDAGFINKVDEVKRLLAEADGFYQSGQYDKAMKRYDQVLTLDPYNTAARRGQERIDNTKYQYGEEAYNETRARQMWKVEEAWQQPVRKYGAVGPVADNKGRGGEVRGTAQMTNKMNSIIIPHVEFRDTTIREAIEFLREQAAENDPSGNGVNIVLRLAPLGQIAPPSVPVFPPPTGTALPCPARPRKIRR